MSFGKIFHFYAIWELCHLKRNPKLYEQLQNDNFLRVCIKCIFYTDLFFRLNTCLCRSLEGVGGYTDDSILFCEEIAHCRDKTQSPDASCCYKFRKKGKEIF